MERLTAAPTALLLATFLSAQTAAPAPRDVFGPGWRWELPPTGLRDAFTPQASPQSSPQSSPQASSLVKAPKLWVEQGQGAFVPSGRVSLVHTSAGNPVLTHLCIGTSDAQGSAKADYRPVLFAADGQRIWPDISMSESQKDLTETRYLFPLQKDPGAIQSFGLAVLDLEGKRARAKEGAARAQELGASVLPLPI